MFSFVVFFMLLIINNEARKRSIKKEYQKLFAYRVFLKFRRNLLTDFKIDAYFNHKR